MVCGKSCCIRCHFDTEWVLSRSSIQQRMAVLCWPLMADVIRGQPVSCVPELPGYCMWVPRYRRCISGNLPLLPNPLSLHRDGGRTARTVTIAPRQGWGVRDIYEGQVGPRWRRTGRLHEWQRNADRNLVCPSPHRNVCSPGIPSSVGFRKIENSRLEDKGQATDLLSLLFCLLQNYNEGDRDCCLIPPWHSVVAGICPRQWPSCAHLTLLYFCFEKQG